MHGNVDVGHVPVFPVPTHHSWRDRSLETTWTRSQKYSKLVSSVFIGDAQRRGGRGGRGGRGPALPCHAMLMLVVGLGFRVLTVCFYFSQLQLQL